MAIPKTITLPLKDTAEDRKLLRQINALQNRRGERTQKCEEKKPKAMNCESCINKHKSAFSKECKDCLKEWSKV